MFAPVFADARHDFGRRLGEHDPTLVTVRIGAVAVGIGSREPGSAPGASFDAGECARTHGQRSATGVAFRVRPVAVGQSGRQRVAALEAEFGRGFWMLGILFLVFRRGVG